MSKVKIKNISTYKLSVILDNVRSRRDLEPGQETTLPDDVFEEFNYDPGCRSYVRSGFLKVITESEAIKEQLVEAPANLDVDVVELLTTGTVTELAKVLKECGPAMKEKIADAAIKHSVMDAARAKLIEVHCGIDVLKAASLQRSIGI